MAMRDEHADTRIHGKPSPLSNCDTCNTSDGASLVGGQASALTIHHDALHGVVQP